MRDPKRIDRMLASIKSIWHQCPDMRLGQLLLNACPELEANPFYTEDDAVELGLEKFEEKLNDPLKHFLDSMG